VRRFQSWSLPAFLVLAFLVLLYGNRGMGLFESSEARYAEVAREMVDTGDYLSPQIDYVHHFTKPPLTYWITAAGYRLFGVGTFGARFFVAAASVLLLALTAWLYRLERPGSSGVGAAAFLFFSLEFFALSKVLTTDLYLALWITAGFLLWRLGETGRVPARVFSLLFGVAAALGFMTKGPICLLFWGVVLVPYALWKDRGRGLRPLASPWCWGPFALLILPWFVTVGILHPGLLRYLILKEAVEAAYSSARYHPGSFYYYLPVLLAGFLPWWILVAARWREALKPERRLWLLWAVLPVLLWSVFVAKLPTYVLPVFPAWSLLAAGVALEGEGAPRWSLLAAAGVLGGVILAALWYLSTRLPGLESPAWAASALLLVSASLAFSACLPAWRRRAGPALVLLMGACLAVQLAVPPLCDGLEGQLKIKHRLGKIMAKERLRDEAVLEYKTTLYSIPFYLQDKVAAYQNSFIRKKYVEKIPPHILAEEGSLQAYLERHPRLWVVTDLKAEPKLEAGIPGLTLFQREGYHSVWVSEPVARRLGIWGRTEAGGIPRAGEPHGGG
jgi:4-amino-4-deoxy-L-arabinose transferase